MSRTQDWSGPHIVADGTQWPLIIQLPLGGIFGACRPTRQGVSASVVREEPPYVREPLDDAAVACLAASEHIIPDDYLFRTVCSSKSSDSSRSPAST